MPMAVEDICKLYAKDPAKVANCNEFLQAVAGKVGAENGLDLKARSSREAVEHVFCPGSVGVGC